MVESGKLECEYERKTGGRECRVIKLRGKGSKHERSRVRLNSDNFERESFE